jgi:hypothetical protein
MQGGRRSFDGPHDCRWVRHQVLVHVCAHHRGEGEGGDRRRITALGIYKPSVIFGNSNTPTYLRYVFPAVQWVLPSRYHSIHKNELARAMFEGTQKALAELLQKQAQGGALPEPEVKSYEYSDMKPFFNEDDRKD